MRIFGSERLEKVLSSLGMKEGEAIVHPWVNKSLERAQAKVEGRNFDIRKQLLKFDDVMNDQRKAIFAQRREIMEAEDLSEIVRDMRHQLIDDLVHEHMPPRSYADQWDIEGLTAEARTRLALDLPIAEWAAEEGVDQDEICARMERETDAFMAEKAEKFGQDAMRNIEKQILLQTIDAKWREHLVTLEHLRSVVGFRGYAQRDPLAEYKTEGFALFETLLESLRAEVTQKLGQIRPLTQDEQDALMKQYLAQNAPKRPATEEPAPPPSPSVPAPPAAPAVAVSLPGFDPTDRATWGNPSRNDPCPCGSGLKFKHCHGKLA